MTLKIFVAIFLATRIAWVFRTTARYWRESKALKEAREYRDQRRIL